MMVFFKLPFEKIIKFFILSRRDTSNCPLSIVNCPLGVSPTNPDLYNLRKKQSPVGSNRRETVFVFQNVIVFGGAPKAQKVATPWVK